ncbi:MAG: dockerin type I repeat-containing protein [Ruminococcus sp.]|nr:dockerin type I repeat-containing protein [Ruminococcus sp.]
MKGSTVTYKVNLYSPFKLSDIYAKIDYDADVLNYVTCSSAHLTDNNTLRCDKSTDRLDVRFTTKNIGLDFTQKSCAFQIEFKLLKTIKYSELPLSLTMDTITDTSGFTYFKDGAAQGILTDISWDTSLDVSMFSPDSSPVALSDCTITLDQTHFVYDGNAKTPVVTVKNGSKTYANGTDYTCVYENNVNLGLASVYVMGTGSDLSGTEVVDFTIGLTETPLRSILDCTVIMDKTTYTYNGQPQIPEITVKDGDKVLTDGIDYILIFVPDNVNVGTCAVHISGFFNYCGTVSREFEIVPSATQKISISACTISMDKNFTYTGSAITPAVTVTFNGNQLVKGTDYTVTYSNNTNPGTATATITGKGTYTGSATVNFTIKEAEAKKIPVTDCAVTLDKSVYTYDGTAKKPVVTVKYGSKTLTNGTDYTVSYSNNTNVGNASVTITGKGNYTGSVTKVFSIQAPQKTEFTWGVDNWNFNNSAPKYFPKTSYRYHINDTYLNALKSNLTNSEYYAIFESRSAWLDSQFAGSCYGMSSTTLLAKEGLLPFANYQSGATKLTDLAAPVNNMEVSSLVTYYQMLQVKDIIQQQYRTVPSMSNEQIINNIISTLNENTTCIVGFKKAGWGGHAILAYGYEYGSWTFDGITYDGCIKICDPNRSTGYSTDANIYFNTRTYSWTIPLYSYVPISSSSGAVFNYVGANIDEINQGGYLSGSSSNNATDYVARIDAIAIANNRAVSKVVDASGLYMNNAAGPGEIVEDVSYIAGGTSQGTTGYNLFDAESAYKVIQGTPSELSLTMDYEDCYLTASSKAGTSVLFDNEGYVEVNGEAANFSMSMTLDNDYPTSWFTLSVEGTGANFASLDLEENGYILSSDNLTDISIKANNKEVAATASFSTNYDSVFIYEINENTIGVKVDTDDNGTYETDLDVEHGSSFALGDVNLDNDINIKDATAIQKHIAKLEVLTGESALLADYDEDGVITIKDATAIQKKIAGLI